WSHELLVELRHRRDLAGTQALDFRERELSTRSRSIGAGLQAIFEPRDHVACSTQHARQARADAKLAAARWCRAEHRVERHGLPYMGDRHAQKTSHPEFGIRRNVADVLLHQPQERQHRRPRLVVTVDDFPGLWLEPG